jgi:hypothetical protein
MPHIGYLEHYLGHDSSYWVQALDRHGDNLNVLDHTGTLTIDQTTMDIELTGEPDADRSAYLFTLGAGVSLETGTWLFTSTATHADGQTYLLSAGKITIMEAPHG